MLYTQPEGYFADPPTGHGPGVLVLHTWWGLNDTIKNVCDRLAQEGFVAFAPDLYHGQIAETIGDAERLSSQAEIEPIRADIAAAVDFLCQRIAPADCRLASLVSRLALTFPSSWLLMSRSASALWCFSTGREKTITADRRPFTWVTLPLTTITNQPRWWMGWSRR
jgi:hypothetical protein